MPERARLAVGSLAGAALAACVAPLLRPFFSVPSGGIGFVTVANYPKGWDYAVVALLIAGAFVGGLLAARRSHEAPARAPAPHRVSRRVVWIATAVVFVLMLFIHDHPYALMDPFHEGEHLTPAFLLKAGAHPYRDVFFLHGFAIDGGLDSLTLGNPPSPRRPRRLETVLDAATLALLVPIAAELTATTAGLIGAVFASLCAIAALQLPVFPYFRLAPVLLAALGLMRYARAGSRRWLFVAFAASTSGVLWSLDTGLYALTATALTIIALRALRLEARPAPIAIIIAFAVAAMAIPIGILIAVRADLHQFAIDSFVIIPRSIDAIWSLPARKALDLESARYYLPPAFYGALLALGVNAWRRGDRERAAVLLIVAIASIVVFRTAAGRCGWSHTRYGIPLFGIATVAFVIEPLLLARRCVAAGAVIVAMIFLAEAGPNLVAGTKMLAGWRSRQSHAGLVPYPFRTGRGIYTSDENSKELAALNGFIDSIAPHGARILDVSNERALYYLMERRPPLRCADINMLSSPPLLAEAMAQLEANRPACVIVKGYPVVANYDGLSYATRVPALAAWIDATYPRRVQIGRFTVATR
ncbi:MAG: hypothetical protein ACXVJT_05490 [Thermoanaerobaculia bacterium]